MNSSKPACICGLNEWEPFPDSLAIYCKCGRMKVLKEGSCNKWEDCGSLQEWAHDLFEASNVESV